MKSHCSRWLRSLKQITFFDTEYAEERKQARRERFLIVMDPVVPWTGPKADLHGT